MKCVSRTGSRSSGINFFRKTLATVVGAAVLCSVATAFAGDAVLPQGARLAIVGDSITEQKLYSKFIETYLLACAGRNDMHAMQFGWSGETAGGFAARLANDLAAFKPTVATTCYGMNDGGYRPFDNSVGAPYEKNMRDVLAKFAAIGVKTVVVGSPGAVDTKYYTKPLNWGDKTPADGYNASLKSLRDIDEKLAKEFSMPFADVHTALIDAMAKAKAALGADYAVCGRDGVHPGLNGQLVMAYAFLKALGCDGAVGEIVVDMASKSATANEGHKVVTTTPEKIEIVSSRYPFCFQGDAKTSGGTRSILPYLPFNKDLNRLVLKVKGLPSETALVAWGTEKKEFAREKLEQGINLAAEFEKTPFDDQFNKVMQAVADKQAFETGMIKQVITNFRWLNQQFKDDAQAKTAMDALRATLEKRWTQLDDVAHAVVVPVRHTLSVTPALK